MLPLRINTNIKLGMALLGLLLLLFIASFILPEDAAFEVNAGAKFLPPSWEHWLGTDQLGRDCFCRIALASRAALTVGTGSVLLGGTLGIALGLAAGWFGGWLDLALVRLLDALKAIPSLLLALMIVAVFGSSLTVTVAAIAILAVPLYARIARSGVLQLKTLDYVQWTRLIGIGSGRVLIHHILPNIRASLIVTASLGFANAILTEASLSYLGLGVPPPDPSWGKMLAESQGYLFNAPWLALGNGVVLTLLVLGFNLLGDGLQQYYDVTSR